MASAPHYCDRVRTGAAGGFSLVELLVVIAIISVITLVGLVRHSAFGDTILLGNLAYDVALSVREAQASAISVRADSDFVGRYGVFISRDTPDRYLLFVDGNADGEYGSGDTTIATYTLRQGYTIDACAALGTTYECNLRTASIVFVRPQSDARIRADGARAGDITLRVHSPGGATRAVRVTATGQISVD